jgi:putative multiple sugar transport system substrate-binding protein
MKKFVIAVLILALVAGFSFAGGQKGGGGTAAASSGGGLQVGIAMPETHVQRWVKDGNSLKAEAEKRGYKAEVQWANADQPTQNQQIQSFLTQGAKVLIVGNLNEGVGPVITEAARDKVTVIAYDRIISGSSDYNYYITFNNFKVGVLQGQAIETALNLAAATASAPKIITLFAGMPSDGNAAFFYDGAMSILNPYIDKGVVKVVGPYPKTSKDTANFLRIATEGWSGPIAKTRMENLLNGDARSVTLDAVLAPNDTLARAIIEALKADAKYRTKLPIITGQDAEIDSAVSIKNGEQYATVFKDTNELAKAAILLADNVIKGNAQPDIPGAVIASGDLKEIGNTGKKYVITYLLDPISVTKANLNVPIDAGFYPDSDVAKLK